MESFGHYLKSNRERQGIRLEEIASITKINLKTLEYLEQEAWKKLPPEPFIRGFIVAYAKYVHLDTQEVLKKYLECVSPAPFVEVTQEKSGRKENLPEPTASPSPFESRTSLSLESFSLSAKKWAFAFAGVVALLAVLALVRQGRKLQIPEVLVSNPLTPPAKIEVLPHAAPKVEEKTVVAQEPGNASPIVTAPPIAETRLPAAQNTEEEFKHAINVEGNHRSWIKVVVDDSAPQEFFLNEGQKIDYKAKEKIKLVLGNSSGAKVIHNGEETPGKKLQGTIRTYIFPENARFPQDKIQKVVKPEPAKENKEAVVESPIATPNEENRVPSTDE